MSERISRLTGRLSRVESGDGFVIVCPRRGEIEKAMIFGKKAGSSYRCREQVKWPSGTLPEGPCCRLVSIRPSEAVNHTSAS